MRLLLDAGASIPPALLVDAARAANLAGDPELGAELAQLAVADGGGVEAVLVLARAHAMRERFTDAEAALAAIEPELPGHPSATAYLEQRIRVLFWGLGRSDETRALAERARGWSTDAGWAPRLLAMRMLTGFRDNLALTIAAAGAALADPALDAETRRLLETRLTPAPAVRRALDAGARRSRASTARRSRSADYTGLMVLPVYRIATIESGVGWPELADELGRILTDGVRYHDHEAAAQAAVGLAYLEFLAGRFRAAGRWLAEAELHFEREDAFGFLLRRPLAAGGDRRPDWRRRGGGAGARAPARDRVRPAAAGALEPGLSGARRGLGDMGPEPTARRGRPARRSRDVRRRDAGVRGAAGA